MSAVMQKVQEGQRQFHRCSGDEVQWIASISRCSSFLYVNLTDDLTTLTG